MTKIAIITTAAAGTVRSLYRAVEGGSRFQVALVLTDFEDGPAQEAARECGIETLAFAPGVWAADPSEITSVLEDRGIGIVVAAGFLQPIPEPLRALFGNRLLETSGSEEEMAPEALEALLQRMREETASAQWAKALKLQPHPAQPAQVSHPDPRPASRTPQPEPRAIQPAATPTQSGPRDSRPGPQDFRQASDYRNPGTSRDPRFGQSQWGVQSEPMPPTYLVWSILCCVCCCFPAAIVALVNATRVSSRYYQGDIEGARKCSRRAEIWIIVSFTIGIVTAVAWLPMMLLGGE